MMKKELDSVIRKMTSEDKDAVVEMMQDFYSSPAVLSNGSKEIFETDIEHCVNEDPYLEGYIFETEHLVQGYAMITKCFSPEFGKPCIWVEDLYFKPECRGLGLGSMFFSYLKEQYPCHIFKLEVEEENERAIRVYKKNGFDVLPYVEMKMETP